MILNDLFNNKKSKRLSLRSVWRRRKLRRYYACMIPGTKGVLGCSIAYYRTVVESPRQLRAVRVLPKKQYRPKLVVCLLQNKF